MTRKWPGILLAVSMLLTSCPAVLAAPAAVAPPPLEEVELDGGVILPAPETPEAPPPAQGGAGAASAAAPGAVSLRGAA